MQKAYINIHIVSFLERSNFGNQEGGSMGHELTLKSIKKNEKTKSVTESGRKGLKRSLKSELYY